jgi:hypothetical protein
MTRVRADELMRLRDHAIDVLRQLDDTTIRELARRSTLTQGHDGYPPSTGSPGGHGGDVSRPTETTAVATVDGDWRPDRDPQQTAITQIRRSLTAIAREATTASRAHQLIQHITDGRRGRETTVAECLCCHHTVTGVADDRIRGGLCNACRTAWARWKDAGHPHDRAMFVVGRQAQLAGEAAARAGRPPS